MTRNKRKKFKKLYFLVGILYQPSSEIEEKNGMTGQN